MLTVVDTGPYIFGFSCGAVERTFSSADVDDDDDDDDVDDDDDFCDDVDDVAALVDANADGDALTGPDGNSNDDDLSDALWFVVMGGDCVWFGPCNV